MNSWESVKELQASYGRLDFRHIYAERNQLFSPTYLHQRILYFKHVIITLEVPVSSMFYVANLMWLLVHVL